MYWLFRETGRQLRQGLKAILAALPTCLKPGSNLKPFTVEANLLVGKQVQSSLKTSKLRKWFRVTSSARLSSQQSYLWQDACLADHASPSQLSQVGIYSLLTQKKKSASVWFFNLYLSSSFREWCGEVHGGQVVATPELGRQCLSQAGQMYTSGISYEVRTILRSKF